MDKDYYEILGVPPDASITLIKSVYRSLGQIYHPDKYAGDKKYAEEKMKEINEAYSILSNPTKRKDYDSKYRSNEKNNFENDNSEDEESFYKTVKMDWEILTDYYPDIEQERKHLLTITKRLAVNFQINLIGEKNTKNWKKISKNVVNDYFNRYFGKDKKLHRFVEFILIEGNFKVANEINKAVKVLGDDDVKVIIDKIKNRYSGGLKFLSNRSFEMWKEYFGNFDYRDFSEKEKFKKWLSNENFRYGPNSTYDFDASEEPFLATFAKVLFIVIAVILAAVVLAV